MSDPSPHEHDSHEGEPLPTRRKRLSLGRAIDSLRRRATIYRTTAAVAIVALVLVGMWSAFGSSSGSVPLGTGKAGIEETASAEHVEDGQASFYGDELTGNPTASGEQFDPTQLTAAHPTLPLGSRVRVTNLRTGDAVVVRINDRGPYSGHRVIDLSRAAARQIGMIRTGTSRVRLELLPQ